MPRAFSDVAFTPAARAAQERGRRPWLAETAGHVRLRG